MGKHQSAAEKLKRTTAAAKFVEKLLKKHAVTHSEARLTGNLKEFMRENVDWITVIKTVEQLAIGNYPVMNAHGVLVVAQPNLEASKLLLNYGFGLPTATVELDENAKKSMEEFSKIAKDIFLPTKTSVDESGNLTVEAENELPNISRQPS